MSDDWIEFFTSDNSQYHQAEDQGSNHIVDQFPLSRERHHHWKNSWTYPATTKKPIRSSLRRLELACFVCHAQLLPNGLQDFAGAVITCEFQKNMFGGSFAYSQRDAPLEAHRQRLEGSLMSSAEVQTRFWPSVAFLIVSRSTFRSRNKLYFTNKNNSRVCYITWI